MDFRGWTTKIPPVFQIDGSVLKEKYILGKYLLIAENNSGRCIFWTKRGCY